MNAIALARQLLERLRQPGALLDGRGRILAVNELFCALVRADSYALLGRQAAALTPGNPLPWKNLGSLKAGESLTFSWSLPDQDRSPLAARLDILENGGTKSEPAMLLLFEPPAPFRCTAVPVMSPRALESLELRRRYQVFFDLAPLGMFTSTTSGRFLEVNRALATMLGFDSPQQVLEQVGNIAEDIYVDPGRRQEIVRIIQRNPSFAHFENEYRRRDGGRFTAHLYVTVLDDVHEEGPCLLGVVEDITHRKQAEEELRLSREKFQSIFDNAPVGIYQSTLDGRYLNVNPEFAGMFGFSSCDEVLQEVSDIGAMLYADPKRREDMLAMLLEKGAATNFEARSRRKDGSLFWTMRNVRLMRDEQGRPAHIKGFVTDVSQQKELEQLREDVERITRHDIKSPILACIFGVRMLQREENMTPRQLELLAEMEKSGQRMLAMINLSLDLYKMERGTYVLEPQEVNLLGLLRDEASMVFDMHKHKGLDLEVLLDGRPAGRGEVFGIHGEELLCRSMFMNLLQNAAEASSVGGTIRILLERGSSHARICIHNSGAVPQEIMSRLFEKYVTAGKRHGTGLGTYSARLIAKTHGGSIRCESSEEQGTRMIVELPLPGARHVMEPQS